MVENNQSQALVTQQRKNMMLQINLKGKWVVLDGIEVSTPYEIYEVTLATYGFVSHINHEGQTIRVERKGFLTERVNSIQSQMFVFIGKFSTKICKMPCSYK